MITSRIFGGLGNQLFQYATGRALALAAQDQLQLDTRLVPQAQHGAYALKHFNVAASPADPASLPPGKDKLVRYGLWRAFGRNPRLIREQGLGYDNTLLAQRGEIYLHGYWQTEKYFARFAQQLRDDLTIVTPPSAENVQWLSDISKVASVSVHLRRGDYLASGSGGSSSATCDAAYYGRALEMVANRAGIDPFVFVFSDDPVWARDNLSFPFETRFVGHNGADKHYEDIRLIAACQHNIIANSTFSWWGAWLNNKPSKCVVAPQKWFNTDVDLNPDILPESWLKT